MSALIALKSAMMASDSVYLTPYQILFFTFLREIYLAVSSSLRRGLVFIHRVYDTPVAFGIEWFSQNEFQVPQAALILK